MTASTVLLTGANSLIGFPILLGALQAGHNVRNTVRSAEKAKIVASKPAVKKLALDSDRLSAVVVPDFAVDDAFDEAMEGITHIIHVGSAVPRPGFDAVTQVFEPT